MIRNNARFFPFKFNPRRIPNGQIKSAAILKYIGEFEFPMEEPLFFGDVVHNGEAWNLIAERVDIDGPDGVIEADRFGAHFVGE